MACRLGTACLCTTREALKCPEWEVDVSDKRDGGWSLGAMTEMLEASERRRREETAERVRKMRESLPEFRASLSGRRDEEILELYRDFSHRNNVWDREEEAAFREVEEILKHEVLARMGASR